MKEAMENVKEFHTTFNAVVSDKPNLPTDESIRQLRVKLIAEEFDEYLEAEKNDDIVEIADALADMVYVICGCALTYGIPLDKVFSEVHRSNMTKACEDIDVATKTIQHYQEKGVISSAVKKNNKFIVLREGDNKVLKSVNYSQADIAGILGE